MCLPLCVVICSSMCLSYFTYPSNLCLSTHLSIYLSIYPSIYLSTYLPAYLPTYPYIYIYFRCSNLELIELLRRALQILFRHSLLAHTKQFISLKSFYPNGTDEQVPFPCFGGYLTSFSRDIGGLSMRHFSERTCRRFVNFQFPWTTLKKYDKTKMMANPNSSGHVNINKKMWMQLLKNEVEISLTFTWLGLFVTQQQGPPELW